MSLQSLIRKWWNQKTPLQKQEFLKQRVESTAEMFRRLREERKRKDDKKER